MRGEPNYFLPSQWNRMRKLVEKMNAVSDERPSLVRSCILLFAGTIVGGGENPGV